MAGRPRTIKPEPSEIRGICIMCNKNRQARYRQSGKIKYRSNCQVCNNRKYGMTTAGTKEYRKKANYQQRLRKYGITEDQHQQMLEDQSLCCAICNRPETAEGRKFAIDHCHTTGKVRGLLCFRCNTAIGKLDDNPELLEKSARYLRGEL